ncbi:Potassium-transporting ATPase ATP-binding subunit [uncultured archaeon]|nr:Potassium-transporting ATPase ATP-binding subunit [uncultured archaeon]
MQSANETQPLWQMHEHALLSRLGTTRKGLSSAESGERLALYGRNEFATESRRHWVEILASQFRNALVLVLIAAAVISFFLGDTVEAAVIFAVVLLNAFLGFFQEHKAEKALLELRKYVSMRAKVMRDEEVREINAADLVPGDIVYLNIGDIVPADIRLLHCDGFTANESALTGESVHMVKNTEPSIEASSTSPQDIRNGAFMGTTVSGGEAFGAVVATGHGTFFGKSAAFLKKAEPPTEFEKSIGGFSIFLLKIIIFMSAFIFATNFFLGKGLFESFLFALALAVGITPEMLPMIITIAMSQGALKLAKKKVVVKKLNAIEGLGNMDTLCCDKTGTLTEDSLSLEKYVNLDAKADRKVLVYSILCNSAKLTKASKLIGRGIDKAILMSTEAEKLGPEADRYSVLDRSEFDFERRRMAVLVSLGQKKTLVVKGAPDSVMHASAFAAVGGRKMPLGKKEVQKLMSKVSGYEKAGFVVIAVAEKRLEKSTCTRHDENGLTLIGFLLFSDPPKKTAAESLRHFQHLGVDIKILSGDSVEATRKTCADVAFEIAEGRVVSGNELARMEPLEFEGCAMKCNVFARLTPEQKMKVVAALNKEGHIVGFLGDGINDAPALRAADVGISVYSVTDFAKEASDIILLEKSLKVVGIGIHEGRKTFGNITKYILNTISANYGNMFTVAFSSLFLKFIPLLPSQILLNNFLSDVPMTTVSTDNVDADMLHKPKKWNIEFIKKFMYFFGMISSFFDLLLIFSLIAILGASDSIFRTAWFLFSVLTEITVVFVLRTRGFFYSSLPSRLLMLATGFVAAVSLGIIFMPIGAALFEFEPLPVPILAVIAGIVALYLLSVEIAKHYFYGKMHVHI